MKNRVITVLKFLIGWPLSIVALYFLFKLIAPQAPQFLEHINNISYPLLTYGMISFLIYYFLRGYIWKRLIRQEGYNLSYKDTNFVWAASELKRYIPGNIWSFVGRTLHLTEMGMTKKDIAKCTLYEIELLVIGSAGASLLALPFLSHYLEFPAVFMPWVFWAFLVGLLLFAFHRKLRIKLFILPGYHPVELLFLSLLTTILFCFFGLGYFFTFASFTPIDPNLIYQLTGISVLSFLVGYLSLLTPSGIGVREGALVFALSKIMPLATASFVALFGRFILIVGEVIFVALSYIWYLTKNKAVTKIETWIGEHKHLVVLFGLMIIYTLYFTTASNLRFENFYTGKYDLGNMTQTIWNTMQGRIFTLTNPDTAENSSRLAIHADFLLIFLTPLYAVWPDPRNLLFIQAAGVSLGALFVYLIAKDVLRSKNLALVFGLAFLINPSIQRANLYDFHAVVLATTFLLASFYFLLKKRYWIFLLFAVLAGITKEQIWVIIALFGVLLFVWHKKRLFGSILFTFSIFLAYLLISHAIPNALGSQHFALSYYSEFGSSPLDIIRNILFDPQQTIDTLIHESRKDYLKQLFYPLGYLSLFAPWFLLFALPELTINLLSNNPNLYQIYYQYTAAITPFLFIAAIYGVVVLQYIIKRLSKPYNLNANPFIIIYLLSISLYSAYLYGPLPGAKSPNLDMMIKPAADKEFITQILSQIPQDARVATSNNLGAHLSHRQNLYILPLGIEKSDYIVFYLTPSQPVESLQKDMELIEQFKQNAQYELIAEKGIFVVFKVKEQNSKVKNTIQN